MALDQEQRASYMMSILLLMAAFPLNVYLLRRIWMEREKLHVLQLAMAWLLMADLLMICNYVPHHATSIVMDEFKDGIGCQISGWLSLVCVLFSNLASSALSIVTNRSLTLNSRGFGKRFRENYYKYTAGMFLPGIVYASALSGTGEVGNYRGLYCCMENNGNAWLTWSGFAIFSTCGAIQFYYYMTSYNYVSKQMAGSMASDSNKAKQAFVNGIRDHALRMSGLFYTAWLPMMIGGIVTFSHGGVLTDDGEAYPRAVDVFIVLCVKVIPLLDSLVILRSLDKVQHHGGQQGGQQQEAGPHKEPSKHGGAGTRRSKGSHTVEEESKAEEEEVSKTPGGIEIRSLRVPGNPTAAVRESSNITDTGVPEPDDSVVLAKSTLPGLDKSVTTNAMPYLEQGGDRPLPAAHEGEEVVSPREPDGEHEHALEVA